MKLPQKVARKLDPNAEFWRRLAYAGARYGPEAWLKYSPPMFGVAFALALPAARATVRDNLRSARGERSLLRDQMDVFRTFAAYAHCLAESLALERPQAAEPRVRMKDEARVRAVLGQERGAVVVTAHAGSWDVAARLLVQDLKREVMVVMQREPDAGARELHDRVRAHSGLRVFHVGTHPVDALPLLRHLRSGGLVAIQLDRVHAGARSVEVELFGGPFRVPEGPFLLAALAGVPVLPVFVRRCGHFEYEFSAGSTIDMARRPSTAELHRAAQQATADMEAFIRAHPTQWFHFRS